MALPYYARLDMVKVVRIAHPTGTLFEQGILVWSTVVHSFHHVSIWAYQPKLMENVVGIRVQIHPVALFTIVDSYERRQEPSRRVIGTLLGIKERAGVVEIRSGYAVPHNETEEEVSEDSLVCL